MGTREFIAGGNPAMDKQPIQGGVEIDRKLHTTETWISSGLMAFWLYLMLLGLENSVILTVVALEVEVNFRF